MGYFTSVADDLNSGLPRTNPAGGSGQDFFFFCYKSSALTAPPRLLREMSNLGEFAGPRYSDL